MVGTVGYCGDVTETESGLAAVSQYDVERIQAQLRPGSLHPAAHLWTLYVRLMEADRRPIAHRTALGHALRAAGWKNKRVRKRVGGRQTEVASWFVPGETREDEERQRVKVTLEALGEGIWAEDTIWTKYQELGRTNGWRWSGDRVGMIATLTRMGFPRMTEKGRRSRYVASERAAKL